MLINYEMPWNPMRVEQRIGRIDRIGQEYDRVWIRNYFYQGTVEATVYQRLDDRIASFEGVVGELQPILAQVARVIEAAAMANDKKRGEMIAKAVEEINRRVQSAEISAFDLDKLTNDEVAPVSEEPLPITMQELERTLVESQSLGERFRPHPRIPGLHLLDWHGHWREVTFDLELFDEHPNSLTLLSYGNELLKDLLRVVEPPHEEQNSGVVARCSLAQIAVGYYGLPDGAVIVALGHLIGSLNANAAAKVRPEEKERIRSTFAQLVSNRLRSEEKAADDRRKAQLSSLTEEIRQLLVEAALVELAQAANRDCLTKPCLWISQRGHTTGSNATRCHSPAPSEWSVPACQYLGLTTRCFLAVVRVEAGRPDETLRSYSWQTGRPTTRVDGFAKAAGEMRSRC